MKNNLPNTGEWAPCPAGTITELATRLQQKQRQSFRRTMLLASLLLAVGSAAGYFAVTLPLPGTVLFGQISCSEVQQLLPDLIDGTISEPDADRVRKHLAKCSACRDIAESMEKERADRSSVAMAWASHAAFQARNFRLRAFGLLTSR